MNPFFSDLSRGRQSVANCVVFLIKAHYEKCEFHNWSKHELHNVLHGGDLLYQKLRDLNDYDFLHPSCIPCHMKFDNANIIEYHISDMHWIYVSQFQRSKPSIFT